MPVVERQADWIGASTPEALVRVGDLASRAEVAQRLGVSRSVVYAWAYEREKTGFPEPLYGSENVGSGSAVYHFPTVIKFYEQYKANKPKGGAGFHRKRISV